MSRRPAIRQSDIDAVAASFEARGQKPCAIDCFPSGMFRLHFTPLADYAVDDLDRELAEFERKNDSD